jgi:HEAT repeat protein
MNHIFISYDHGDADFATVLRIEFEKAEHNVWVDQRGISAGDDWRKEIDEAIQNAKAMIVVMSPEAARSEYVTYEWAYALGSGVRVIPVLLRATSLHPRLQTLQHLDFSSHSARPWGQLLLAVRREPRQDAPPAISPASQPQNPSLGVLDRAIAALDSISPEERLLALETLGQSNDKKARAALLAALHHSLLDVRIAAATSVAEYDFPAALPSLMKGLALNRVHDKLAWPVRNAFVRAGRTAVPSLIDALTSPSDAVWGSAANVLGAIGDPTAVPALLERLRSGKRGGFLDGRREVVQALGEIGSDDAVEALIGVIADRREDPYTVRDAIWSLGKLGATRTVPFLVEQLPRQSRETQTLIVVVLGVLGDDAAVPILGDLLTDKAPADDGLSHVSRKPMCDHVADALRRIGSANALAALSKWKNQRYE